MEVGRIVLLVVGMTCVGVRPTASQETEGRNENEKVTQSRDEPVRAFARPDVERLDDATRDLALVLGIGLLGFAVLILGKYFWYEPRMLQKPYRPTKIKKSHRAKSLAANDESMDFEESATVDLTNEIDLEAYYQSLEEDDQ